MHAAHAVHAFKTFHGTGHAAARQRDARTNLGRGILHVEPGLALTQRFLPPQGRTNGPVGGGRQSSPHFKETPYGDHSLQTLRSALYHSSPQGHPSQACSVVTSLSLRLVLMDLILEDVENRRAAHEVLCEPDRCILIRANLHNLFF